MKLTEQLTADMKKAAKDKDKIRLGTIRMVRAEIKNQEIARRRELSDDEILKLLATMVKQRREAIAQFKKGGRDDLVQKEEAELRLLQDYLPAQLSSAEIEQLVKEAIAETGASGKKDMGQVMKKVMPRVAGRADGREVNRIVAALLS